MSIQTNRKLTTRLAGALPLLLSSLVALGALTACGSKSESAASDPHTNSDVGPETVTIPRDEVAQMTATVDFECQMPGGLCPPALAMSVARLDQTATTKLYKCTAFLVSNDIVATNAHCLPADLRSNGVNCADRMTFYFGDSSEGSAMSAGCDHVISATNIDEDPKSPLHAHLPDIAFIKLKAHVARTPLSIARTGIPDQASLVIYAIDPANVRRGIHGIARAKLCTTEQNSLISPQYTNDFANVISASCSLVLGNSGSPAIGADGRVYAILQAVRSGLSVDRGSFKHLQLPSYFSDMAAFTNMACAETPPVLALGTTPATCRAPFPGSAKFVSGVLGAEPPPDLEAPFAEWTSRAPKIFGFINNSVSDRQVSYPKFVCLTDPKTWLVKVQDLGAAAIGVESFETTGQIVTIAFRTPVWGRVAALDEYERISTFVGEKDRPLISLSFNIDDAKKNHFARVSESLESKTGFLQMNQTTFDLSFCP